MNRQITKVEGSLEQVAKRNNQSIAETFISTDVVVMVDTSGSMGSQDSRGGKSRYDVACEELARLQNSLPGRIAVIAFSSSVVFIPSGVPPYLGTGTDVSGVLKFAKVADIAPMRFFLISDGFPDNADLALRQAEKYESRIDTIHVGPEGDKAGMDFLKRLADASGGKYQRAGQAVDLAQVAERLLKSG